MMFPRLGWWQRLRHGRGFGVHSPSAYRFIREVLREECAYYAYPEVDALAASWPGGARKARMLLRIVAAMRPHSVAVGASDIAARIVRLGGSGAVISAAVLHDTDFVVMADSTICAADAFAAAARGATVVMPDRSMHEAAALLARLRGEMAHGHIYLDGGRTAIFVGNNAPFQTFAVRF